MKYQSFLIKYAEIGIKGKNRLQFEEALIAQIRLALKPCAGKFTVSRTSGRIFVDAEGEIDHEEAVGAMRYVFGIAGICPMVKIPVCPPDEVKAAVVRFMAEEYPSGTHTFKMHTRRQDKQYPLDSQVMNAMLGEAVLESSDRFTVDVHEPEILMTVEIRDEAIYLYSTVVPGPGGLPVGIGGKAMLCLSGGIDSPVAGWMMGKRGLKIDAVYFNAPPYTSERALQKVVDLASIIARYTGPVYLHNINFTAIQLYIYEKCPHDELTIIMRRFMMRIAERLAKETECGALITGESLGQVASQTMASLAVTGEVCTLPVFRPLIGFDKEEIIAVSKRIGAYETSILPYEDCCTIFVAKHPVTKPNLNVIKRHEVNLEEKIDELVEEAIRTDDLIIVDRNGRH